ncbi:hypothetical protein C487_08117 [Natrinema pallidum DSM 3751]|uniref:Uncharacterized protein n=1 Tax=Natrinema pallidum DSM 3751 TaxID=1227495 RepID=L9YWK4_9EURY|nr:hypothetical protein C487_08117 [Natrinema pallidum DSM 3751]
MRQVSVVDEVVEFLFFVLDNRILDVGATVQIVRSVVFTHRFSLQLTSLLLPMLTFFFMLSGTARATRFWPIVIEVSEIRL